MRTLKRTSASNRDRWLAELAEAIDEAAQLAWRLGYIEGDSGESRDLFDRLGALRAELETIRSGRTMFPTKADPMWVRLSPSS